MGNSFVSNAVREQCFRRLVKESIGIREFQSLTEIIQEDDRQRSRCVNGKNNVKSLRPIRRYKCTSD